MVLHNSESSYHCDQLMSQQWKIEPGLLMEVAGKSIAEEAIKLQKSKQDSCVFIICGPGNNGGDGLVAARFLFSEGFSVRVYALKPSLSYKYPSKENWDILLELSKKYSEQIKLIEEPDLEKLDQDYKIYSPFVIVDAIFGVGIRNDVEGYFAEIIDLINQWKTDVISVDIPSGINSDTGKIMNIAIKATQTITFSAPKIGHYLYPGKLNKGNLVVRSIGIPWDIIDKLKKAYTFLNIKDAESLLPLRPPDSHKGSFGSVYIIGGCHQYRGALKMSIKASYRCGAGKVFASYLSNDSSYFNDLPQECIHGPIDSHEDLWKQISDAQKNSSILCVGPGLGRNQERVELVKKLYLNWNGKMLIDADGLYAVQSIIHQFKHPSNLILTPHLGEMAMITGQTIESIKKDPVEVAKYYANQWDCTLVLKSANTIVASPGREAFIQPFGNSGLSTAGTGDVLSGMISAFATQSQHLHDACVLGSILHGYAGTLASNDLTEWSMTAGDLIEQIPASIKAIKS